MLNSLRRHPQRSAHAGRHYAFQRRRTGALGAQYASSHATSPPVLLHGRHTHMPVAIFLSRPMLMLQECRRLLQHGDQMLLDAPDVQHDHVRAVDALAFTAMVTASSPPQPASSSAAELAGAPSSSDAQSSAAQPVFCESEAEDLGDAKMLLLLREGRAFHRPTSHPPAPMGSGRTRKTV